ncbi:transposase [Streptomyces sp. NPDC001273]
MQTTLKASYTNHYRKGLIELLGVLEFRSNNFAYRPVIDALELVQRYAKAGNTTYYPPGEVAPAHRGTTGQWAELVHRADRRGRQRIVRMVYEVATFQALREQLRCKEVWVVGAGRWRNPDEDLPTDFEARRTEHYGELRKPLNSAVFTASLRQEMERALADLDEALPELDWVQVTERKAGAIKFTVPEAQEEPRNLRRVKSEVSRRWNAVPLIDMLKEAVLRTGCVKAVAAVAGSGHLAPEVLAERLMLAIYAYGTNAGIRSVAGGVHGHTEEEIRYVRRRYLTPEAAQQIAVEIANATFAARDAGLWGLGSTAVASDSTHFRSWDQNLFTEWHSRYGGRGILVYWHVERGSVVVHSQTLRASASEVAAMVEGAIRHGTTMSVEGNYVDSHGQSEIGFGVTRLLNVDLLPRIKQINRVRLYRPNAGEPGAYPNLQAALTRPIRWDVINANYDQVIKYATAIRTGTASTEAILSRFTRAASHPAYQAMLEIGRAQRTCFVARYLRDRDLQRESEEGLNVVESWNAANAVIYYGKGGEISTNRREEVKMAALCLRILQASLVYVNTLMLQDVLAEPQWAALLGPADRRGLTPLFWQHVRPYGEAASTWRLGWPSASTYWPGERVTPPHGRARGVPSRPRVARTTMATVRTLARFRAAVPFDATITISPAAVAVASMRGYPYTRGRERVHRLRQVFARRTRPHGPARHPARPRRRRGPHLPRPRTHRHQPRPPRARPGAGRRFGISRASGSRPSKGRIRGSVDAEGAPYRSGDDADPGHRALQRGLLARLVRPSSGEGLGEAVVPRRVPSQAGARTPPAAPPPNGSEPLLLCLSLTGTVCLGLAGA